VRPVQIVSRVDGVGGNADGWGITSPRDEMTSDSLRSATVRLESGCQKAYGNSFNPRSELCVTGVACSGDSGSPLVVRGGIIGVASWGGGPSEPSGWGCSSSRYPSVYTRIPRSLNRPLLAGTL
jgi:hypothetical protein